MHLPSFHVYCPKTTGQNALCFDLGSGFVVWFSYRTCVAFMRGDGSPRVVRENVWGPTTGKHLNSIDNGDKASRVSGEVFEARLTEALCSPTS